MIVIPRETPVVSNLHTSYIKIRQFIGHFRGSLQSGCVYMRAPNLEGALFFERNTLINAHVRNGDESLYRQEAFEAFLRHADEGGQSISVFDIPSETIYYWANLHEAALIHKNLTSSTVNMEALIKKITQDQFTGLIEVLNSKGRADQIHVIVGEIAGAVLGKSRGILRDPDIELAQIISNAKNARTRIAIKRVQLEEYTLDDAQLSELEGNVPLTDPKASLSDPIEMLEELMVVFESTYKNARELSGPFETALKRKFLDKVGAYEFLDPFTEEFLYQDGGITYTGTDPIDSVVLGVTECLRELSIEKGIGMNLQLNLKEWRKHYFREIETYKAVI